jgi:hypothetical protein
MIARFAFVMLILCAASVSAQEFPRDTTWEWVVTVHADGSQETPGSVGYTTQFHFGDAAHFFRYRDGVLQSTTEWYAVVADTWLPDQPALLDIGTEGLWIWGLSWPDATQLTLQDDVQWSGGGHPPTVTKYYALRSAVATTSESWGSVKSLFR